MTSRNIANLVLLAAIWGSSFLLMRVSVPEFGAAPMMFFRVLLAGLALLPFVFIQKRQGVMLSKAKEMTIVGLFNSALPFSLIAFSTLYVTAGFASVLNAATPMCAAVIAFVWLGHRLTMLAVLGLLVGFIGVIILVWDKLELTGQLSESSLATSLAIAAGLAGAFSYGIAANYTKQHLAGVDPMVSTVASQLTAAVILLPFTVYWWPETIPSFEAWRNVLILALLCTGFAQILYFRLIESAGAANATTVTFLIPVFGLLWGGLILDESLEPRTLLACVVILLGTGLTTGLIRRRKLAS
ncbi:DMT family transporter [Aliikangiella sp. G2MR2-5]|uniref:DMT family transporter n=1 Tax=Aliikangiella sp. G2MR2-5 TaxID=2788943 RepID=UPI0018ABF78E|nr:DMT family transporter [Aliikangiella sp. G2MR2-5]